MSEVLGCAVFKSVFNEELGLPYNFECTLLKAAVNSRRQVRQILEESLDMINTMLETKLRAGNKPQWEYIGRSFNMYSLDVIDMDNNITGQIRTVERGGLLLGVYGVLDKIPSHKKHRNRLIARSGETLGITLLNPQQEETIPEGQKIVSKNPIYAVEGIQQSHPNWQIKVEGLVRQTLGLQIRDLLNTALEESQDPFHCVTGWTLGNRTWEGVRLSTILQKAGIKPAAKWIAATSSGGYTAVYPIEFADSTLIVLRVNGKPLSQKEGAPTRLFIPPLYGWKHVKWLTKITLLPEYEDGYWEALGYHERGLVSARERFKIRNMWIRDNGLPGPSPQRPDLKP